MSTAAACPIAVGVAGWSYPDWNGWVYPRGCRDRLRYLAAYVDTIEINSTFYRMPEARRAAAWCAQVADRPRFTFTAKVHQSVTHEGVLTPEVVDSFREGLRPLVEAGRLAHLLAQFRYDYADTPANRTHLARLRDAFAGAAPCLALELRHRSWEQPESLEFLRGLDVGLAALDYPLASNSFQLDAPGVGQHAYLRLHGRNARAWFSRGAGRDETYNYLYNEREVNDICSRALRIAGMSASLTVIANNHYQGKEAVNALEIRARLSGGKVPVPPTLLARYPHLRTIAAPDAGDLFGGPDDG